MNKNYSGHLEFSNEITGFRARHAKRSYYVAMGRGLHGIRDMAGSPPGN